MNSIEETIRNVLSIKDGQIPPIKGVGDRNLLAQLFFNLGFKIGAEIGVRDGTFSEILAGNNPGLTLFSIDPWEVYAEMSSQIKQDRYYRDTIARLSKYKNIQIIKKKSSDALLYVPNGSLDFVYIDASHDFENALFDIIWWSKKVRKGGIVSGHDYQEHRRRGFGVIYAVDAYVRAYQILLFLTGEGKFPSYLWVKP